MLRGSRCLRRLLHKEAGGIGSVAIPMAKKGDPEAGVAPASSGLGTSDSDTSVVVLPRARGAIFAGLFTMIMASSSLYSLLAPFFPTQAEDKGVSTMLVRPAARTPPFCRGKICLGACTLHLDFECVIRSMRPQTGVIFAVFALIVFVASPLMGVHMAEIGQRRLMFAGQLAAYPRRKVLIERLCNFSTPCAALNRPGTALNSDHQLWGNAFDTRRSAVYCILLRAALRSGSHGHLPLRCSSFATS